LCRASNKLLLRRSAGELIPSGPGDPLVSRLHDVDALHTDLLTLLSDGQYPRLGDTDSCQEWRPSSDTEAEQ
jgi:hypothetical protein